jgi:proteasome accessory factor C
MNRVAELVNLVSYLSANPRTPLRQAALATNRSEKELLRDLESLLLVGLPPYDPGNYINFQLIGPDQQILLLFSGHFAQPLSFTATEAMALKASLDHFTPGADAQSAEHVAALSNTLAQALQGRAREALAGAPGFVTPRRTDRMRRMLQELMQACEERRILEIEYYSAHRARLALRRVHPFEIVEIGAHFYLYALCEMADATRHFRVDRIRSLRVLDATSRRRPPRQRKTGRMRSLFEGKPRDRLRVRFAADIAEEIQDEWKDAPGAKLSSDRKGCLLLDAPLYNPFWATGYLMSFGDRAELLEPKWLRLELAETIRKGLHAHG